MAISTATVRERPVTPMNNQYRPDAHRNQGAAPSFHATHPGRVAHPFKGWGRDSFPNTLPNHTETRTKTPVPRSPIDSCYHAAIMHMPIRKTCLFATILLSFCPNPITARDPIPDKLVVLTFDDSVASHYTVVRPILKRYGFGATFYITEGFSFKTNKTDYMTWPQIAQLHRDGFEIGNHTRDHMSVSEKNLDQLPEQIEAINARCAEHNIPKPTSFAYPGNGIHPKGIEILKKLGLQTARRGGAPEFPYDHGRGTAYSPTIDHPLLIPSAGDARPDWTLDDFKRAVHQAKNGHVAVLQFHGVPDHDHPWVHTPPERFEQYMKYLKDNDYHVIPMRDLANYVDLTIEPPDPFAIIQKRMKKKGVRKSFLAS